MNFEKIQILIESSDVVSFDIFDTLITRKVLHPSGIFSLIDILAKQRVNIDFDLREARIEAEKKLINSERTFSYSIFDIYSEITDRFNLSEEQKEQLINIELEAEEKLICPRKDIQSLFMDLYKKGRKIILVSDMYLSTEQIKHLLKVCGYPEDIELFVSNEFGSIKSDGSLWKIIVKKFGGKQIVHIGDDRQSDFVAAKKTGVKSVWIKKPYDLFADSHIFSVLHQYDTDDFGSSLVLGRLCNEILFNNVFSTCYNSDSLTGIWTGAVLACFIRWLINTMDESLLLFVTRECYIFQPMYLEYCRIAGIEPQKNIRFFTSRQAASIASLLGREDMEDLLDIEFKGTVDNFLQTRCGYKTDNNTFKETVVLLPRDKSKVLSLLDESVEDIIDTAAPRNKTYKKYLDKCCEESGCNELSIVDIGYRGTAQYLLSKIRGKEIKGKYLIADSLLYPERLGCSVQFLSSRQNGVHPIYDNISIFEGVLQVPYGQLLEITQNADGDYQMKFNDAAQTDPVIAKAQSLFMDYIKSEAEWFSYLKGQFDFPFELAEDMWMTLAYHNLIPESLFNSLFLDDEFSGLNQWTYNSKKHCMENASFSIPFIYYNNRSAEIKKQKIKNIVKDHTPAILFEPLRLFWIKFIK